MSTPRSRGQARTTNIHGTASSNLLRAPRQGGDTILTDFRQRTDGSAAGSSVSSSAAYRPPTSAAQANVTRPNHYGSHQPQGQSTTVMQSRRAPPAPSTSVHSAGYFERMEYQERERIRQAAEILGSRELLMRYSILHNESIPQSRLRLQKQLVGIRHVPYNPPRGGGASSSRSPNGADQRVLRDMRPDEDDGRGTWAENETVIGPGPLVSDTRPSSSES